MSRNVASRKAAAITKGVVMVGLLASLLSGCAGGEAHAEDADKQFLTIEHVVRADTLAMHPGLPWNTLFSVLIVIDEGLSDDEILTVVDRVILVAQEELASANSGVSLDFSAEGETVNLKEISPMLGDLGLQFDSNLSRGSLSLTQDELKAYESPGGS